MGQFSWLYADTKKQVLDNRVADTYLLVPQPFQEKYGEYIYEDCYDGYGHFGRYDIYILIAEWNRDFIPEICRRIKNSEWVSTSKNEIGEIKLLQKYYKRGEEIEYEEMRNIGILMACYDEDNAALLYPIKITSKPMAYEEAEASLSDPDQGWA